jgi:hypothetical protein
MAPIIYQGGQSMPALKVVSSGGGGSSGSTLSPAALAINNSTMTPAQKQSAFASLYASGGTYSNSPAPAGTPGTGYWSNTGWVSGAIPQSYIDSVNRTLGNSGLAVDNNLKTISASNLNTNVNPLALPPQPSYINPGTVNTTGLVNANNPSLGITKDANGIVSLNPMVSATEPTEVSLARERQNWAQEMLGNIPKKENILQSPEVVAQNAEVMKQRQEVNNYTSQLNAVIAKQNQDLLQLRGVGSREGVTEAVYGGQAATINREAAIKALPLQAAVATAQGNLSLAQDYLKQVVDMKTEQVNNDYAYKIAQFDVISNYVTNEEKVRLDDLRTKNEREYNIKLNNIKSIEEWSKIAIENGQSNLVAQISALNPQSPTFTTDLGKITGGIQAKPTTQTITATDASGRTTATTINTQTGAIISKADLGVVNKPSTTTTSFTSTQLNKGANNAGLPQTDFTSLDNDVKNYYVNSTPTEIKNMNGVFAEITAGTKTPDEVKTIINSANIPDTVKMYLNSKVDKVPLPEQGTLSKIWDSIKGFFGF